MVWLLNISGKLKYFTGWGMGEVVKVYVRYALGETDYAVKKLIILFILWCGYAVKCVRAV